MHSISKALRPLAVVIAASAASAAQAQTNGLMLEEIIVTAEKREASLQDTAIAVTAISAAMLERSNIEDTLDLQFAVPNLMIGGQNNTNLTLRGVGSGALGGGAAAAVGQAFNSMPIAPAGEIYDLERIEVLRGPQGTLFGRNTTGGVVNVISAKPQDAFSADVSVQVANYGSLRTKGALNLPISDTVSQRFAFNTVHRDGYTENVFLNTDVDGRDEFSVRSTTRFDFSSSADATLTVQYFKEDSDRQSTVKTVCLPDPTIGCAPNTGDTIGYPADFPTPIYAVHIASGVMRADRYADNPNPDDFRKVSIDTNPEFNLEETFVGFELNVDLTDELRFTSATAYSDREFGQFRDWDLAAAPNAYFNTPGDPTSGLGGTISAFSDGVLQNTTSFNPVQRNNNDTKDFSQEFRIASDYAGRFNFLAGVIYNDSESDFLGITWIPTIHSPTVLPVFGLPTDGGGFNTLSLRESESRAVFGEIYYDLSDALTLTVGLRYTEDEQSTQAGSNPVGPITQIVDANGEWEEVTGKVNLNWHINDGSSVYATLSRGYKGGGLNPGNPISETFEPEVIDSIELGSKNRLVDDRLNLNVAAFYYDYQDYQIGGLIDGVATNFNAEKVRVAGLEIETVFLATEHFLINANASFLDTEIRDSEPLVNVSLGTSTSLEDVVGNALPNAPETSFSLGAQYTQPLNEQLDMRFRVDYYWQDDFFAREFDNLGYDSWERADVYLSLLDRNARWEVEVFIKNATDNEGITGGVPETGLAGLFRKVSLLDPRTFGVEFSYRWD